ncbi:hypothetical protein [Stutzerimonas kunmingensis]|uniref:hypothetical protein n=1 Tax=Stutzerimonas kunmingensis TaxID=1211807 RepID=UPI0028AAE27B|nr:hypothetical protein [Stutzerimonas kunmingensis]
MSKKAADDHTDPRMARPVIIHDKKTKRYLTLQKLDKFVIDDCEVNFPAPNNVSLFASIAKKEMLKARKIYNSLISKKTKNKREIYITDKNITKLYDYLEHIQSSIIAIYTAIESFSNIAIPNDYTMRKKNQKGIEEIWDKSAIERWYTTSDKISEVLPSILKTDSPKEMKGWTIFKELESIRNDIIHQKTITKKRKDEIDSSFMSKLLQERIFDNIDAGFTLISFFCKHDISHSFFPLGFSEAKLEPIEMDDMREDFEQIV